MTQTTYGTQAKLERWWPPKSSTHISHC